MKNYWKAFNREWFKNHQRILLWLCNHSLLKYWFRWILRIHHDLKWGEKIWELQPNNYKVFLGFDRQARLMFRADFRTHDKFSKRIYFAFAPLWWALHYWDTAIEWLFPPALIPRFNFGYDQLTKNPDADPETSSVDGWCRRYTAAGESWASLIGGAGTSADSSIAATYMIFMQCHATSGWIFLFRSFFLFDTSSLTSVADISSATLSIYGYTKEDSPGWTPDVNIYSSSPASLTNNDLVAADYSQVGSTAFSSVCTYANWPSNVAPAYVNFALNSDGLANISKISASKFSARCAKYDVAATAPSPWGSSYYAECACRFADYAGTTNDPKLVVNFCVHFVSMVDTIQGSEASQYLIPTLIISILDTLTANDLRTPALDQLIIQAIDTVTHNDVPQNSVQIFLSMIETITQSDLPQPVLDQLLIQLLETIQANEVPQSVLGQLLVQLLDSAVLSDLTPQAYYEFFIQMLETITGSDVNLEEIISFELFIQALETIMGSDASLPEAMTPELFVQLLETLSSSEALQGVINPLIVQLSDAIASSEISQEMLAQLIISLFETVAASDIPPAILTDLAIRILETLALKDEKFLTKEFLALQGQFLYNRFGRIAPSVTAGGNFKYSQNKTESPSRTPGGNFKYKKPKDN